LHVDQAPAGYTEHTVSGGLQQDQQSPISVLKGHTDGGEVLKIAVSDKHIRYLTISTTVSPSWVAWTAVKVFGTPL
jgi:hypothetical protein